MKSKAHTQFVRGVCSVLVATCCFSCESTPKPSEAAVPRATAEATALARVKGGKITEGELEKEDGKLVWSFDISQPGTKDIKEIQVDAKTGVIVSEETESAEHEAAEKVKESGRPAPTKA